ncbi:TlpA family protein disulfide reductase [Salicibibacter halophilus]|uniref:TlpA family protein disulfide reductase n=1 Tax=Salicibibacter halophilus TaxID=2502791 RepID=A0A514LDF7_9BACI|nr:TlpA disulfide reductase family protein [Salicibibacter halophilus]QDI89889.1 TlpA family protein disulfide reductase [Salicibibacter halophilus]
MKKWISAIVVLIAVIIIGTIVYENVSSPPVGVNQGEQAPEFELPDLDGENLSLSDFEGDFVVLNLWASWCEPCIREFPVLDQVHETYESDGVNVVAVNMTTTERRPEDAMEFLDENPVTMPIAFDEDGEFADVYPPTDGMPTTYFINEEGIVVDVHHGELTEDMLEDRLQPFL